MVLRFCVVLVALLAACPALGNAAEIMSSREEAEEQCSIADGQQYSGGTEGTCSANKILESEEENSEQDTEEDSKGEAKNELPEITILVTTEGNNDETKKEETQPKMVFFPVTLQEGGDNVGKGDEPEPAIAAPSGGDGECCKASEPRNEETEPTMMVVPVAITDGNAGERSNDEKQPNMIVLSQVQNSNAGETRNDETQPNMIVLSQVQNSNAGETRNDETQPNMIVVSSVHNSNAGETKNGETEPNMIVVSSVHNSNAGETKNDETEPNMIVVSSVHNSNAGETKNDETEPNMIVVSSVHNSNAGETKNEETQPAVQVDPSISNASNSGNNIDTRKPRIVLEPDSSEETSDEKKDPPTQGKVAFVRDDKENEIQHETLDKDEDKAEEEDASMDACQADENEIPDLLKDNHHIKKDLKCKMSNEIKIGVLKKRHSEANEIIDQKEILKKQNLKRAIDTKLAMDFVALLDRALGYPYNKVPNFEVDQQYNPWRQYTLASISPDAYQSYYS